MLRGLPWKGGDDLFPCRARQISTPLPSSCLGEIDELSRHIGPDELNANFEDGGTGLEIMHFRYWVMRHSSIGKGIMATDAQFNATTGSTYPGGGKGVSPGIYMKTHQLPLRHPSE